MVTEDRVFEMKPYPVNSVSCYCNYNRPYNVNCKWSRFKNSHVRCVRKDGENKFNEGDSGVAYDDMYESYDNY